MVLGGGGGRPPAQRPGGRRSVGQGEGIEPKMSAIEQWIDELAAALVLLDPRDENAVAALSVRAQEALRHASNDVLWHLKQFAETLAFADIPLTVPTITTLSRSIMQAQALNREESEKKASRSAQKQKSLPSVHRDEETIAIFADFLQEADEGMALADETLMEAERSGLTTEHVHALFRVFHTIKGVAGFLDLEEVQKLAHITETLMDLARDGVYTVDAVGLEVLLESTQTMRQLVGLVSTAVNAGTAVARLPQLSGTLEKLDAVINKRPLPSTPAPDEPIVIPMSAEEEPQALAVHAAPRLSLVPAAVAAPKPVVAAPPREAPRAVVAAPVVEEPEEPRTGGGEDGGAQIRQTIKLDVARVDDVVEMIGELVIVESMLTHSPELEGLGSAKLSTYLGQLAKISRDLQNVAMRMRMVPVRTAFQKMPRIVRETGKKAGKDVQLVVSGEATEMDRSMVDRLAEPLMHMLRNSVDHGLETRDERVKAGKPAAGKVTLSAYHEGSSVVIEVADDGRGLAREAILAKARRQGLVGESQVPGDDEIYQLIFAPGFSTAAQVTEISGRGVGMDVVKKTIESMRGRIVIRTEQGKGTTFKLVLPLTLAIIDATVVGCGAERYIIPSLSIVESIQVTPAMLGTMGGHRELLRFRGRVLPLFRAANLFGVEGAVSDPSRGMVVVVDSMNQHIALFVDEVVGQQQVVIKSLDGTLAQSGSFVGAAIISDGQVALILNVDDIGRLGESWNVAAQRREEVAA
jgi:two-component system chemotaxis sensor kinase CheA